MCLLLKTVLAGKKCNPSISEWDYMLGPLYSIFLGYTEISKIASKNELFQLSEIFQTSGTNRQ